MEANLKADLHAKYIPTSKVQVGDTAVHHLDKYARRKLTDSEEGMSFKYTPRWSLPHLVTAVINNTVRLKPMGVRDGKEITASANQVRVLQKSHNVAQRLQNLRIIDKEEPRRLPHHVWANPHRYQDVLAKERGAANAETSALEGLGGPLEKQSETRKRVRV